MNRESGGAIGGRLSLMMFLEFFVWGAWYVTVGNFMAANGMSEAIYWAFSVSPIAAIVSPFFLGLIADRYFATERVFGVLHLIGGVALLVAPYMVTIGSSVGFILLLLLHMLCYMPTLALGNSLSFHHIVDQEKQFPLIRVFGTVGWIVAGILVSAVLHADLTATPLYVAGIAALVLGFYSFTLPHTPPPARGKQVSARDIVGIDAWSQLRSRSFTVFVISSLLICIPLSAYYAYAPVYVSAADIENPAFKMSFGQMSEVLFMLAMPVLFIRLGVKWMLVIGMLAWVVRYLLFALAAPDQVLWMIMGGIVLHGICYDFFFVAGQIYVDKKATAAIRSQAQGFIILVTYGIGMLIGAQVAGLVFAQIVPDGTEGPMSQWQVFWFLPAAFAFVVMLVFAALFNDRVETRGESVSDITVARDAAIEPSP